MKMNKRMAIKKKSNKHSAIYDKNDLVVCIFFYFFANPKPVATVFACFKNSKRKTSFTLA